MSARDKNSAPSTPLTGLQGEENLLASGLAREDDGKLDLQLLQARVALAGVRLLCERVWDLATAQQGRCASSLVGKSN
eukprot:SAG11_NODE_642_length_8006_cov_6.996965_4_plen_78_part_00